MSSAIAAETLAGKAFWFINNLATVKVSGEETDGAWSLVEFLGGQGDAPPLHVHHREDEAFYVLEGELTLFADGREHRLRAGEAAVGSKGIPHTYRVESGRARWLVVCSPAGFERFVAEAAVPAETSTLPPGPPAVSPERLTEIAAEHRIEILGPPGALPA